jgi:hypothetical protein
MVEASTGVCGREEGAVGVVVGVSGAGVVVEGSEVAGTCGLVGTCVGGIGVAVHAARISKMRMDDNFRNINFFRADGF